MKTLTAQDVIRFVGGLIAIAIGFVDAEFFHNHFSSNFDVGLVVAGLAALSVNVTGLAAARLAIASHESAKH
jgi:hypothetical protein